METKFSEHENHATVTGSNSERPARQTSLTAISISLQLPIKIKITVNVILRYSKLCDCYRTVSANKVITSMKCQLSRPS